MKRKNGLATFFMKHSLLKAATSTASQNRELTLPTMHPFHKIVQNHGPSEV